MAPEPSVAGWGLAISTIMLSMISCEMCAPNAWVPRAQQFTVNTIMAARHLAPAAGHSQTLNCARFGLVAT